MKIRLYCMECTFAGRRSAMELPPQDGGLYRFECEHGHQCAVWLQVEKYEMLFEIGLKALLAGFPRAAVTDFASSLERFYEFAFWIICGRNEVAVEEVRAAWSDVGAQSERQRGLFIGSYVAARKQSPPMLPRKMTDFRNDVVHKGVIPTQQQAISFGQAVIDTIWPIRAWLIEEHEDLLFSRTMSTHFEDAAKAGLKNPLAAHYEPVLLHALKHAEGKPDLATIIQRASA